MKPDPSTVLLAGNDGPDMDGLASLLASAGYATLRARTGSEALDLLATHSIDSIVCEARLPEMRGAQLLERVAARWPDVPGLLILEAQVDGVAGTSADLHTPHSWLRKPWRDAEVLPVMRQALRQRALALECRRLGTSVGQLEHELQAARERSGAAAAGCAQELQQTIGFLHAAEEARHRGYAAIVKLCANLVGLRDPSLASLAQTVAEHARALALKLGMDTSATQDVVFAALLHHIGKLALPDHLLNKPFERLSLAERVETGRYPVIGATLLVGIEPLQTAALYIRHQNECFDGQGQPDGLVGDDIPLGARILSVAKGYHALQRGGVDGRRHTPDEAIEFLRRNRRSRYDPAVVDAYLEVVKTVTRQLLDEPVLCITTAELTPGMVLARDVLTDEGALLLTKNHVLDTGLINRLRTVERNTREHLTLFVWRGDLKPRVGGRS